MSKALQAPQNAFVLPVNTDTRFATYGAGDNAFLFAVTPLSNVSFFQVFSHDYESGWTMDLYPQNIYVFEIPPNMTMFWLQAPATVYGYFPGRDY